MKVTSLVTIDEEYMCDIKLTVENNDKDLLMTITPVEGQPKADLKKLQLAFKKSDYAAFLLIEGAMELLLEEVAKANENLKKNNNDEESEAKKPAASSAVIANAVDAVVEITLDTENMSATLELKAGYGGNHIKNSDVVEALKEKNVVKGIIKENLINIVKEGLQLKGGKSISTEIAKGKISVNGKNGHIKYLVDDPADRVMRPKKLDNGNVDMLELGDLIFVKAGRKLAQVIPPTYGVKGFNVIGSILDAVPGERFSLVESEGSSFLTTSCLGPLRPFRFPALFLFLLLFPAFGFGEGLTSLLIRFRFLLRASSTVFSFLFTSSRLMVCPVFFGPDNF